MNKLLSLIGISSLLLSTSFFVSNEGDRHIDQPNLSNFEKTLNNNETPGEHEALPQTGGVRLTTTYALNLRSGAGTRYRILTTMPRGTTVTSKGSKNGWYKVTYKGKTGWASGKYMKKTATKKTTTAKKTATKKKKTTLNSRARAVMRKHGCGNARLIINDPRVKAGYTGTADWYNNAILLSSKVPSYRLNYVVAHECAHLKQYKVYRGNVPALKKKMNSIYGGSGLTGVERNADCITRKWGYKQYYYTNSCGGARGKAAQAIIKGKKP